MRPSWGRVNANTAVRLARERGEDTKDNQLQMHTQLQANVKSHLQGAMAVITSGATTGKTINYLLFSELWENENALIYLLYLLERSLNRQTDRHIDV